jgi:hypothetical protein
MVIASTEPGPLGSLGLRSWLGVPHVVVLRWPEEAPAAERLRPTGVPRLLLVAPDAPAPDHDDCSQDWVRLPATEDDIRLRATVLAARAARHAPRPVVEGDGRVALGQAWVAVSETEEAVARILAEHFGSMVDARLLAHACDPPLSATALRAQIMRLRRRLRPLGLVIETVRARGYVLECGEPAV